MPSLYAKTKRKLAQYNIRPQKKFGQNFLIDSFAVQKIIELMRLSPLDTVLEIGSGTGNITEQLLNTEAKVFCVEWDTRLVHALEDQFSSYPNFSIVQGDAAKIDLPPADKVVGNLPFSAAAPIMFRLAENKYPFLMLTFQYEFAQKMLAPPNSSAYGRLSVMSQFYFDMEPALIIPPKMFYPTPEIVSQVLMMHSRPLSIPSTDVPPFQAFITMLFGQRRKLLRKVIRSAQKGADNSDWINQIPTTYPHQDRRIFSLTQTELLDLFTLFQKEVRAKGDLIR